MVQTEAVRDTLKSLHEGITVEIDSFKTSGDKTLDKPLAKIGDKGLFTQELEESLRAGRADLAVHCLKDVPTAEVPGLVLGAVLERGEEEDALVVRGDLSGECKTLSGLPKGSVVGTSSLRRRAMLSRLHPGLSFVDIRGNLQTRLGKLDDPANGMSATILATVGLQRMGLADRISQVLPAEEYLYAVGQGALTIQCRADDPAVAALLAPLHHKPTALRTAAERALMSSLEGGCHTPLGVHTALDGGALKLKACVLSLDGSRFVEAERSLEVTDETGTEEAGALGREVAGELLAHPTCPEILKELREYTDVGKEANAKALSDAPPPAAAA